MSQKKIEVQNAVMRASGKLYDLFILDWGYNEIDGDEEPYLGPFDDIETWRRFVEITLEENAKIIKSGGR